MSKPDSSSVSKRTSRRTFLKTSASGIAGTAVAGLALDRAVYAAGSGAIKIGMVGCGGRCNGAAMDAMSVDPGIRLVAMCDLFADRVQRSRTRLKARKPDQVAVDDDHCFVGFDAYKKVIQSVDVVLIACAAKFHPLHMTAAIEAGKHVFVEKPHAIDPLGVKGVVAACELAGQKKLSVVSGLQSRFHTGYQETVKRMHDGAIGEVVAIEEHYLRAPYVLVKRAPGLNEVQYQCSNQYHFNWLSGDDVPQSLIHNVDRSIWAMREQVPAKCHALAGRSAMFDEIYGNVFDHHAVVYEFANGAKLYAFCRTTTGCHNQVSSLIYGTKGRCRLTACRIDGENKWQYQGPRCNPYHEEHKALFGAVRSGKPISSGYHMANSTLATVMGQLSCYTGKEVTWDRAAKSDFYYPPKADTCSLDMEPPVKPGPDGRYPVYVPGKTTLL